jgi:hypothetical protein
MGTLPLTEHEAEGLDDDCYTMEDLDEIGREQLRPVPVTPPPVPSSPMSLNLEPGFNEICVLLRIWITFVRLIVTVMIHTTETFVISVVFLVDNQIIIDK